MPDKPNQPPDEPSREEPTDLSASDFERLTGHIGEITRAELPLAPALAALAEELPPDRFRRGLRQIIDRLETGMPLEQVLSAPRAPAVLPAIIRVGVRTGRTGEVLGQYLASARQMAELRRRGALVMGYPLILLTVVTMIFIGFLALIVPGFKRIFDDFGTDLPGITWLLIKLSNLITFYGQWVLLGIVLLIAVPWVMFRWGFDAPSRRRLLHRVPVIGPLVRYGGLARFARLLALLVRHEVPLPEALTLAGDAAGDAEIADASRYLSDIARQGGALAHNTHVFTRFPASLMQALSWREYRDALPESLLAVAEMFEGRSSVQMSLITAITGPIVVIFVAVTGLFLVLGLFTPMIRLLNNFS